MSDNFLSKYGPWAIVTGASSGIGEEFAKQLAKQGLSLVLIARRIDRLTALANYLTTAHDIEVRVVQLDLTDSNFWPTLESVIEDIKIGLLVSSAGDVQVGKFLDLDLQKDLNILDLHAKATTVLVHKVGDLLRRRRRGGIIIVSSIAAYQPSPYVATYAATKAYLQMLGESLWYEFKEYGIDVLTVAPGPTATELYVKLKTNFPAMQPFEIVAPALQSLGHKQSIVPGFPYWLTVMVTSRILPRRLATILIGFFTTWQGKIKAK